MLFFVKQVHTPDHCPARLDQGPDALFEAGSRGVELKAAVADVPRHTLYFLVEADEVEALHALLEKGRTEAVAEISPVKNLLPV